MTLDRGNGGLNGTRNTERRPALSWSRVVRGYLVLPHLAAVALVLVATAGFAVIAWGGVPPTGILGRMLLAMLGGQLAIGALNDIIDLPDDLVAKPEKPLPSGAVTRRGAHVMVAVGLALLAGFGISLGLASCALLALGTGLGIAYDLWGKRTSWSWLPYLLALPLLPIWVFVTLGRFEPRLLLIYPLGALATVGVHFAQALPDVVGDRRVGMQTVTSRLGERFTLALAWLATLSAPLLAWGVARLARDSGDTVLVLALGLTLLLMAINAMTYAVNRRLGVALCFPLVGLSVLASGFAWTINVAQ